MKRMPSHAFEGSHGSRIDLARPDGTRYLSMAVLVNSGPAIWHTDWVSRNAMEIAIVPT